MWGFKLLCHFFNRKWCGNHPKLLQRYHEGCHPKIQDVSTEDPHDGRVLASGSEPCGTAKQQKTLWKINATQATDIVQRSQFCILRCYYLATQHGPVALETNIWFSNMNLYNLFHTRNMASTPSWRRNCWSHRCHCWKRERPMRRESHQSCHARPVEDLRLQFPPLVWNIENIRCNMGLHVTFPDSGC